ncbi:plasmid partitioning protein RepB C-terminal domain-containing protein [Siccirubricoccus phaeus]|uniref:plasmid partitioning protein RepB C-terminal domain-containing protein n=1 Tax=Siccirubricoccus phaeus TaxID=2595053 RepID=UPI001A9C444F|nr:plasmid partitioning protein RepB C-terminal domain-containing protein [Siccirubricoccus phaeus]
MGKPPTVPTCFEPNITSIKISQIDLLRPVAQKVRRSAKYARVASSIAEVGIIEPPAVVRKEGAEDRYLLLDGHLRLDILVSRGVETVDCLLATDDEAVTYNRQLSRLAVVQEHRMILKAIHNGASEQRIARALNIDMQTLREKKRMLSGVCPEVVELLKDRPVAAGLFRVLKRMLPLRQIEAVELMIAMDRFTITYADALLAATPQSQLVPDEKPKQVRGLTTEQVALMERESGQLERELRVAERSYGPDHMHLVVARGYLSKLLGNVRLVRHLA